MIDLAAFQTEIMGIVRGAWPEITAPNVEPQRLWTSVQALRKSFLDDLKGGRIDLPCAVMQFGSLSHDPQWGPNGRTYRVPLSVFYIDSMANGATQLTVHAKASALALAIDDGLSFGTFQSPPERATVDSSEDSPVNMEFLGESGIQVVSSVVRWDVGLLTSA